MQQLDCPIEKIFYMQNYKQKYPIGRIKTKWKQKFAKFIYVDYGFKYNNAL